MCGLLGICSSAPVDLDQRHLCRMRDLMAHRGPDGAGLWFAPDRTVALAHRRLAVLDPDSGAQPWTDDRAALVYNGELYNNDDLRCELARAGVPFRSRCDTETVFHALRLWGADALPRFRGMFALAFFDRADRTLLLARDPLGIKPLYWARIATGPSASIVFASEILPILAHPTVPVRPDFATVSAYLTTIRTTLGTRTLFEGVRTLPPGGWARIDCTDPALPMPEGTQSLPNADPPENPAAALRRALEESVALHLRCDVPLCALLSGGIDSAAITAIAVGHAPGLRTWCSGCPGPGSDIEHARRAARALGTHHSTAPVSESLFRSRWDEMVQRMGLPLSTPNEVAINEVARRLRAGGAVVALSGEGADELLGGYELPMRDALAYVQARGDDPGAYQVQANAWVPPSAKPGLLTPDAWRRAEHDEPLYTTYRTEFERIRAQGGFADDEPGRLADHLRFLRAVNLPGLLARLDTATMLESVEGRTPFADAHLAALCESIPMADRFSIDAVGRAHTKSVLRRAVRGLVPDEAIHRPKASFPLPFQGWMAPLAAAVGESALAADLFTDAARAAVAAEPARLWNLAWPMINLALWGRRWWG